MYDLSAANIKMLSTPVLPVSGLFNATRSIDSMGCGANLSNDHAKTKADK